MQKKFIILDTEYVKKKSIREVFQISAISVDSATLEVVDTFNTYVRPQNNYVIPKRLKRMCRVRQEQVDSAPPIDSAARDFLNFSADKKIVSFGNDLYLIEKNVSYLIDEKLFSNASINLYTELQLIGFPVEKFTSGSLQYFSEESEIPDIIHDSKGDVVSILTFLKGIAKLRRYKNIISKICS